MNEKTEIISLRAVSNGPWLRCLLLAVVAAACRTDPHSSELAELANGYCFGLETDLQEAAQRHGQLASAIDENRLSPDQLQRADDDLAVLSIGNTVESRRARLRDFESRFNYCESVRQVDAKTVADRTARLQTLHEGLSQNIWTHTMPTAAKTAELLDQFRALVHEVNASPMKR